MIGTDSNTKEELKNLLNLSELHSGGLLNQLEKGAPGYLKDLKVNFKNAIKRTDLEDEQIALLGLALSTNEASAPLIDFFRNMAFESGASEEEVAEGIACGSLLAANNVLYRFRHFAEKEEYEKMPAGIRMNIMMKPVTGKADFELMSLAVSAANGCERCVKSHERSLLELGISEKKIFQAIRLASVIASMAKVV